jgi:hypothetical protein
VGAVGVEGTGLYRQIGSGGSREQQGGTGTTYDIGSIGSRVQQGTGEQEQTRQQVQWRQIHRGIRCIGA